jgi:hypothetical protein
MDKKFDDYFREETKVDRAGHITDSRVHVCLYFIAPTGHGYVVFLSQYYQSSFLPFSIVHLGTAYSCVQLIIQIKSARH